ncbi:hypothetical protein F4803DRAFT_32276 [Xylaria telfairii]|nr:hypothetical protein F4803DRAFT_32276 [Xylaria telfairii]
MAGMGDYAATYPTNMAIDERFKRFISSFYAVSDDASRNEEWVAYFTPLADVIMGDKRARGEDEIRQLREGMWENIKSRKHKLEKIFPATFGKRDVDPDWQFEYMLHGTVDYEMKNGDKIRAQWAGRASLVDEDGLKLRFYDVYVRVVPSL